MSRQLPVPSPGPRWEALKEPSHPSSSDEESGDENTAASVTLNAHRPQQPLKRKDNDRSSAFASVAKRPRHELEREGHGSTGGSASAPGPSSSSRPSSAQAGPSRIPNHRPSASLTGISAGPSRTQSSSSGTRKGDTSQEVSTVPRPRPKPRPQHISVFSNPERDDYDKSSSKKNGKSVVEQRHFSGSSSKGKKPASQATKPKFISNEIIEISSGSESDPPPRITFKPKSPSRSSKSNNKADIPPRAKKTSGNGNKGNKPQSSSKRTGSPEIIVISDSSDEEVNKAPVRTSQPVKTAGPSKQESEKRLPTPPPSHNMPKSRDSDIAMDVDNEVGASVADMEVDQVENIPPPMVAEPVPPLTPSPDIAPIPEVVAPVSAPKPATPPRPLTPSPRKPPTPEKIVPSASPSTSTQPSVSRMSSGSHSPARKPTLKRPSVNLLPAPPLDADVPPPPPKRKLQSGIKTASVTRRMSSSSSGDDSGSERSQLATGSREASSAPEEGIDMRDANAQLSQSSEPHRTSVPGAIQLARKSTGGVGPRPKLAARNSIGGEGTPSFTLAEAIMNAGKLNASYKHRKGVSIDSASSSSLSSERKKVAASNPLLQHAKASASKIYSKSPLVAYEQASKLGFSSAVRPAVKLPSEPVRPPSRSDTDELLLRPSEPTPPPVSPSPVVQTPTIPAIQPSLSSESGAPLVPRRRSAPSLGDATAPTLTTEVRPSASVLQTSAPPASAHILAGANVQARPASTDAVPKVDTTPKKVQSSSTTSLTSPSPLVFPKLPTRKRHDSPPIPSSLPESPSETHASAFSSPAAAPKEHAPTSPPQSPTSSKLPQAQSSPAPFRLSFSEVVKQGLQEKPTEAVSDSTNEVSDQSTASEAASDAASATILNNDYDINMSTSSEGRPSPPPPQSETSEDEAMKEAAEVEALVEDDLMDFRSSETVAAGEDAFDDALPSLSTRRSSRMSSRSSTSDAWPASADDTFGSPNASRQTTPEDGVVVHHSKTYGGFEAITWPDHVKITKNRTPKYDRAEDIPHLFEDHVNNMTWYTRMMPEMRKVYEARILENTAEDEPDAPPIEIQNDVDEEATPPWEFFYSNKMWHGEGVPPPDTKSLVRCNCKGACSPKSKTCACLKRQREACQDPNMEFAYDKTGKLKIPGYPIFECNDFCGCGDECRNRVVQHGRKVSVALRKTVSKGWGVFATKKILAGSFIGIYSGELITDVVAQKRGIKYNKFGRTYLFDIDFHHLRDGNDPDWTNQFTVDAYHAGNFTRFLNHSCDSNSRLFACYVNEGNIQKPLLVVFSLRDIEPDEEICFNYNGDYPDDDDDPENERDKEQPHIEGTRDIIYERCMCGARNCTGVMFK